MCFVLLAACAGPLKRSAKHLEKENFAKVDKLLHKSLEKDSINPGANYLYSLLYNQKDYANNSLDSAYNFVNEALYNYAIADGKKLKKLHRLDIDSLTLTTHKTFLDSLAFERAQIADDIAGYNYFIDRHPAAIQVPAAISRRNDIAFADAREINTYESYRQFMDTYPDAEQLKDATELYDILLFEGKTRDKKLESYIAFLENYPKTPYRAEAEKHIFEISTAGNTIESYHNFIKDFPDSRFAKKAVDFMFHTFRQHDSAQHFFRAFPDFPTRDSLQAAVDLATNAVFPIYGGENFGFMNSFGEILISPAYETVPPDYLCGGIAEDFLLIPSEGNGQILSKKGEIIYEGGFENAEDIGFGLIRIENGGKFGVVHKAGHLIMPLQYEHVALINNKFILYNQQGLLGLLALNGRNILEPEYQDIYALEEFIILQKDNKLGVTNAEKLVQKVNQVPLKPDFIYDEVELIEADLLHAFQGEQETVLDENLNRVFPLGNQNIYPVKYGWLVEKDSSFMIYNDDLLPLANQRYKAALFNKNWLGLKKSEHWGIMGQEGAIFPEFIYDSLQLISENFALLFQRDSTFALFSNGSKVDISEYDHHVQLLRPRSGAAFNDSIPSEFLLASNQSGYKRIYNNVGQEIISGFYTQVDALSPHHLVIEKNNRKGLINESGESLLPIRYNGIANYNNGYLSTLSGTKFGIFNDKKEIDIAPGYDVILQPYNDSLLIVSKRKKFGIIDRSNKTFLPFEYDEVRYWTDSLALAKGGGEWKLINFYKNEPVYEGIENYKVISNNAGEIVITFYKGKQYGLLSNKKGEVLAPSYQDIFNIGTVAQPVYFAEKAVEEADMYVAIYFDDMGNTLRSQAFSADEFEKIICD